MVGFLWIKIEYLHVVESWAVTTMGIVFTPTLREIETEVVVSESWTPFILTTAFLSKAAAPKTRAETEPSTVAV